MIEAVDDLLDVDIRKMSLEVRRIQALRPNQRGSFRPDAGEAHQDEFFSKVDALQKSIP